MPGTDSLLRLVYHPVRILHLINSTCHVQYKHWHVCHFLSDIHNQKNQFRDQPLPKYFPVFRRPLNKSAYSGAETERSHPVYDTSVHAFLQRQDHQLHNPEDQTLQCALHVQYGYRHRWHPD